MITKIDVDVAKVGDYLRSGLADRGFVVVIEECDHRFAPDYVRAADETHGVQVLILRRWS